MWDSKEGWMHRWQSRGGGAKTFLDIFGYIWLYQWHRWLERTFSALRQLKNYLRSTMMQECQTKSQKSQKRTRTCYNVHNCKGMWDTGACVSVSYTRFSYEISTTMVKMCLESYVLVVNSFRSHLTELKELSITNVRRCKHRYSTISLQVTSQYLALFHLWSVLSLLAFRCCYCYHLNPARKQRPTAPKLDYDTWTPPRQVSGVGAGAGVRHRKPTNSVQAMLEKNGEHVTHNTIQYNSISLLTCSKLGFLMLVYNHQKKT